MRLVVEADGGSRGNPGPAGWAWVGEDGRWAAGSLVQGTNNIGELLAVLYAIRDHAHIENLRVQADSMYAINTYTQWMDAHRRRGWKTSAKEPTKNVEILEALIEARDRLFARHPRTKWVALHVGHHAEDLADLLLAVQRAK